MNTFSVRGKAAWVGALLVFAIGLIHLIEAPEYFEAATYLGLLFVVNFVGATVAAYGIYKGLGWGWTLGALVTGGAFLAYIVSRTVGLPGLTETEFFEPIGIVSLVVEALFLGLFLAVPTRRKMFARESRSS